MNITRYFVSALIFFNTNHYASTNEEAHRKIKFRGFPSIEEMEEMYRDDDVLLENLKEMTRIIKETRHNLDIAEQELMLKQKTEHTHCRIQ
jgi:hypothetical protein